MDIRADLDQPACVQASEWVWVDSPQPGVRRVMLDRVGDEVAVATSFVRYAPGSRFPAHEHARGEEFIVLDGEFGDEHGRYGPLAYVRNPPGSRHVPFSDPGCLIWVKLRQFQSDDLTELRLTLDAVIPAAGTRIRRLHEHGTERVAEITAAGGAVVALGPGAVAQEVLVLGGRVELDDTEIGELGWLRIPAGTGVELHTLAPSRLFWKTRPVCASDPAAVEPA